MKRRRGMTMQGIQTIASVVVGGRIIKQDVICLGNDDEFDRMMEGSS